MSTLLYHYEHNTREDQREDHDEAQAHAGATDSGRVLLQDGGRHVVASVVVDVVQVGEGHARLALAPVDLLATALGHLALPVAVVVDAAAVQPGLRAVPRPRHVLAVAVHADRRDHLLAHRLAHLLAEHKAQDGTDQHAHEYHEQDDEVGQQQALDFAYCAQVAQNCRADGEQRGHRQHVHGPGEQVRAQELIGVAVVDDDPQAQTENDQTADLEDRSMRGDLVNQGSEVKCN